MALKTLRDNLKYLTWVLWLVILIFIGMVFVEWGGGGVGSMTQGVDEAAATVGGEKISYQDFQNQYQNLERYYRQQLGANYSPELVERLNLPVQALDILINERILLIEARRLGLEATDEEVREAILELPVFRDETTGFIGEERYREILRANNLTPDNFEKSMRQDLLVEKLRRILAQTVYISDAEVEAAYREQAERATIRFVQLPASEFTGQTVVEPGDLEAYYAENAEDFRRPEERRVDYLLVDALKLRQEIEIPETELREYYDGHPDEFTREEQVRARHILIQVRPDRPKEEALTLANDLLGQLRGGADFAQLAAEYSEDEGSAARGGNLNYFGRGAMVAPFEEAAFNAQVGELVGPVETDYGFHLIEVLDRQEGGLRPFEEVEPVISSRLVGERATELAEAKARDLALRIEQEEIQGAEAWRTLAQAEGAALESPQPFGRTDVVPGVGRGNEFVTTAFELEAGAHSEPVQVPRGWAILRLEEVLEPRLPELAEVENEVRQQVEREKRQKFAVERLAEAKGRLEAGEVELDQLAEELGLQVTTSSEFGKNGTIGGLGRPAEVIAAALSSDEGEIGGPFETAQGAVLFEVTDRQRFDPQNFEAERETTRQNQESERLGQLLTALIEKRRRDLSPQYSADVLERYEIQAQG